MIFWTDDVTTILNHYKNVASILEEMENAQNVNQDLF